MHLRTFALSDDTDQTAHLHSLLRVFSVRYLDGQVSKVSLGGSEESGQGAYVRRYSYVALREKCHNENTPI